MPDLNSQVEAACMARQGKLEANGKRIRFLCPRHDDHHPSARYEIDRGLWTCDVCRAADGFKGEGLKKLAERFGIDTAKKGIGDREIVATYVYGDFQVIRTLPKGFYQRRPDGAGGWIHNLRGVQTCLYHAAGLPDAIRAGRAVFVCEGEKDVDRLRAGGQVATCNPMGAGKWKDSYSDTLKGADLAIIPDNDEPGRAHADAVARSCYGKAARIRVIELPKGTKDVSDFLDAGGTVDQLLEMAAKASEYRADTKAPSILKEISSAFGIRDGIIIWNKPTRDGDIEVPLCNFNAWITQDILRDDGVETNRSVKVQGELPGKVALPEVETPAKEFNAMNWITTLWGTRVYLAPMQNASNLLRTALLSRANGSVRHRTIYTHYGWREVDGEMVYLHGAGAVGKDDILVEPHQDLSRYQLLISPREDPVAAVQKSLDFHLLAPLPVSLPLWTAMYLAPLTELIPQASAFTIWIAAKSGSYKSVLTALALSHFGDFDYQTLPAKWSGTANRLEEMLFLAKDMPMVIDDFLPAEDKFAAREQEKKAERIVRSQGDRVGRVRMYSYQKPPRGLLITTGEMLTSGYSRTARILTVEMTKETVELALLTEAQKEQWQYCVAMTCYIDWLRQQWKSLKASLPMKFITNRNRVQMNGGHARMPQMLAGLYTGLEVAADFAKDVGRISDSMHRALLETGWDVFQELADKQAAIVEEQSASRRFIELIGSMHSLGKVKFHARNADMTPAPAPGQDNIGWFDKVEGEPIVYYLDMEAAVNAVKKYSETFTWSPDAVAKQLGADGKLEKQGDRNLYVVRIPGGQLRRLAKLTGLDGFTWS